MSLTFARLREKNLPRCRRWHPAGAPPWDRDDWLLALGGEAGEALNVVKKLNRDRDGLAGNTRSRDELIHDLGHELADVVIYLDICLGWEEPEALLGSLHDPRPPLSFNDFRRLRQQGAAPIAATPAKLGNRLLAAVGDQIYGPSGRSWAKDVLACADRLAEHFGIDLGAAVVAKFNATSDRFGFPEKLPA